MLLPVNWIRILLLTLVTAALLVSWRAFAAPSSTAFTYQGRLLQNGSPAGGAHDFRFQLFTVESGGSPVSEPVTNASVTVSNGVFATVLDFGADVFSGASAWLEIGVRASPTEPFTTLVPRQPLTAVPYSIHTLSAESLTRPVPDAQLSTNIARLDRDQKFSGAVEFLGPVTVRAGEFTGGGAGLSNVAAAALSGRLAERLWRVAIPFVSVTNAGNTPDTNGKGAVPYNFRIGRFEINNHQYAAFLNAIAADDPHLVYTTNMTADAHGGIVRSGAPGDYRYTVKPGLEHRPLVWVEFHAALRFCNWLHHGQPTGPQDATTTEDGAYTMTLDAELANTITRNAHARFWLPSDDEWYKAAYHQPAAAGGAATGYWQFPTRSNDVPFSEMPPGGANSANACCETGYQSTPVGSYLNTFSFYGAFDMAGNVEEWTEEIVYQTNRRLRGGSWYYNELYSHVDDFEFDTPDYDANGIGFRVAGAIE